MSSQTIYISSDAQRQRFPGRALNPSDFIYYPDTPIELDFGTDSEVCLYNVGVYNSVRNVVNEVFLYKIGVTTYSHPIPNGLYTIEELDVMLQQFLTADGFAGHIALKPNYNTNRLEIVISTSNAEFTMQGQLPNLFGFAPPDVAATVAVSGNGVHVAPYTGQMSALVDLWQVRCDLHMGSYDSQGVSTVLFEFAPFGKPTSKIDFTPQHLLFSQVNKATINSIRIQFTDQRGRLLDFNGEDTNLALVIRPIANPPPR